MSCNICGSTRHEATTAGCPVSAVCEGMGVVEYQRTFYPSPPVGWACPVCHKGNAPDAMMCGHCPMHKAASDLLAALEAALPGLDRNAQEEAAFSGGPGAAQKITEEKEVVDQARAAIAKARGQSAVQYGSVRE